MALEYQNVEVQFADGVDTLTDAKAVVVSKLLQAQNVVFPTPGTLRVRNGHTIFDFNPPQKRRLAQHQGDALICTDTTLYSAKLGNFPKSADLGGLAGVKRTPVFNDSTVLTSEVDVAVNGNFQMVGVHAKSSSLAMAVTDYIVWLVVDGTTGDVLRRLIPYTGVAQSRPRVAAVTAGGVGYFWCFYFATGVGLRGFRFNLTTLNIDIADALLDAGAAGPIDVAQFGGFTDRFLFFEARTGLASIVAIKDFALANLATATPFGSVTQPDCVAITGASGEAVYAAERSVATGALQVRGLNSVTLAALFAATNVAAPWTAGHLCTLGRADATNAVIAWNETAAGPMRRVLFTTVSSAGAVGAVGVGYGRWLVSKPWADLNNTVRIMVNNSEANGAPSDPSQSTLIAMSLGTSALGNGTQTHAVAARGFGESYGFGSATTVVSSVPTVAPGVAMMASATRTSALLATATLLVTEQSGAQLLTLDSVSTKRYCSAELGGLTYIAGGQLKCYDGLYLFEVGFTHFPHAPLAVASAGGLTTVGSHNYVATFEYTDAQGNIHRSAPSLPTNIVLSAGNQVVNLSLFPLLFSQRDAAQFNVRPPVVLVPYGTMVNDTVYHRLLQTNSEPANTLLSDAPIALTYNSSDASIATFPTLYTSGGRLPNVQPPSCDVVCVHQDRLFLISAEDGSIWFSKQYVKGEAPGFNDVLVFQLPSTQDRPTALASLDDKLLIFTANAVYAVTGIFPNDTGTGGQYQVDRIPSDVGASDWRSVLVTHEGCYFGSKKGIFLLTRGLALEDVGRDVSRWTTDYAEITAAYAPSKLDEVRFVLNDAARTPRHQELVLNIRNRTQASPGGTWSTFDYSAAGWAAINFVSAMSISDVVWKLTDVLVLNETPGVFSDAGAWVTVVVETANIFPFGRQGFARVKTATFLGTWKSSHALQIDVAYDGDAAFAETTTFARAVIDALPREQVSYHLERQKGSGVRLRLTSVQAGAPTGEEFFFSGLVLECANKRGSKARTLPAGASQ